METIERSAKRVGRQRRQKLHAATWCLDAMESRTFLSAGLPDMSHTTPTPEPNFPAAFDTFTPPVITTTIKPTSPAISEYTRGGQPDDTLTLTGENLSRFARGTAKEGSDTTFWTWGQTNAGDGSLLPSSVSPIDGQMAQVTLPDMLPSGAMYLLWARNADGFSAPVAINRTEAWWVGPDTAAAGQTTSVYGRNLSHDNGTSQSWVYITSMSGAAGQWAQVTSVNPYKVDFVVPANLQNGQYEVWVHNGHGGHYGWSKPVTLTVKSAMAWDGGTVNVHDFGAKGDGVTNDRAAIQAALDAAGVIAHNTGRGATVVFGAGTYVIDNTLTARDGVKWQGAGETQTIIKMVSGAQPGAMIGIDGLKDIAWSDLTLDANHALTTAYYGSGVLRGNNVSWVSLTRVAFKAGDDSGARLAFGFNVNGISYLTVKNSDFYGQMGWLGGARQVFIDGAHTYLTNDVEEAVKVDGGEMSLTNSSAQDYNSSSVYGWGQGRFLVVGNNQSSENVYVAGNQTHGLTVRQSATVDQNAGEQMLWELGGFYAEANAVSATQQSVRVPGARNIGGVQYAVVLAGRGLGQYRKVDHVDEATGNVILVDPWAVTPDSTSLIGLGTLTTHTVVYENSLQGKPSAPTQSSASAGIQPAMAFGFVVDSNTMSSLRYGISTSGYVANGALRPSYFNEYINNTVVNASIGIYAALGPYDDATPLVAGYAYLGNAFRGNTIDGMRSNGPDDWSAGGAGVMMEFGYKVQLTRTTALVGGTVLQDNRITNTLVAIDLSRFQDTAGGHLMVLYHGPSAQGTGPLNVPTSIRLTSATDRYLVSLTGCHYPRVNRTARFTAVFGDNPYDDVNLAFSVANAAAGSAGPAAMNFNITNWNVPQSGTVTGATDFTVDGDTAYTIILTAGTSISPGLAQGDATPSYLTVGDNQSGTPGATVTPTSGLTTTESSGTANFTVVLTSKPSADVTIPLSSSNSAHGAIVPTALVFTADNWNIPQTVTVTGIDDHTVTGNSPYNILTGAATSSDPAYTGFDPADVSVTSIEADVAGITVTPTSGLITSETAGTATFTVVLTSRPTGDVTIPLASSNPAHGSVAPAALIFTAANWNIPQTVTVTGVDDHTVTGNNAYNIVTGPAVSSDPVYSNMTSPSVAITSIEADIAGITITPISGLTTSEAGGTTTFTVVLTSRPTANVSVPLSSSNTAHGRIAPASLTFTAANWNVPQTVTVTGVDDQTATGNLPYSIVIAPAVSADPIYSGMTSPAVAITSLEADVAGISVSPTSGLSTSEAGGTASFTVVLSSKPTANVTVPFSSSNTAHGRVTPGAVLFTAANWNIPQTVTVTGVDDDSVTGNTRYDIVTGPAVSADPVYGGMTSPAVGVTSIDTDRAGIIVTPNSALTTSEAGGTATFTVVLTSKPVAAVTIPFFSSSPSHGTVAPTVVIFTTANWNIPQTLTVTGVDDHTVTGNTPYSIVIGASVSADPNYHGLKPADNPVTSIETDVAGIGVTPTSGLTTSEAGGTTSFAVVLTSKPLADVTVPLFSSNSAHGTVAPTALIFTAANWNVPQTVTVTGADDNTVTGNTAYAIVTGPAASSDPIYNGINPADVSVTSIDADVAGISVTPTTGLTSTEAGGTATFSVVLISKPTADVAIPLASSNPAHGTPSSAALIFTAANWNIPQTVTITGADDSTVTGNSLYNITLAPAVSTDLVYSGMTSPAVAVTSIDADVAGISVTPTAGLTTSEAGGTATFTIVLTSKPTADVTIPLLNSDATEASISAKELVFTAGNWNIPQTVTVTGLDDLVIDGDISYSIVTGAAASTDAGYNGMSVSDVTLTNLDNDHDTTAPTASLVDGTSIRVIRGSSASKATNSRTTEYDFAVRYADDTAIDAKAIGTGNMVVRGAKGYQQTPALRSTAVQSDGSVIATYAFTAPHGTWSARDNGAYTVWVGPDAVTDAAGNRTSARQLATIQMSISTGAQSSVVGLNAAPVTLIPGTRSVSDRYTFSVSYCVSSLGLRKSTIAGGDIEVTNTAGYVQRARFLSMTAGALPGSIVATYRISPMGGKWDTTHNRTYSISLAGQHVCDTAGRALPAGKLGEFTMKIAARKPSAPTTAASRPVPAAATTVPTATADLFTASRNSRR